jgi:hypothetical protein
MTKSYFLQDKVMTFYALSAHALHVRPSLFSNLWTLS